MKNTLRLSLALLIGLQSTPSIAKQEPFACRSLTTYSSIPGTFSDPTGIAEANPGVPPRNAKILESFKQDIRANFKSFSKSKTGKVPNASYVRRLIDAIKLGESPRCRGRGATSKALRQSKGECYNLILDAVTDLAVGNASAFSGGTHAPENIYSPEIIATLATPAWKGFLDGAKLRVIKLEGPSEKAKQNFREIFRSVKELVLQQLSRQLSGHLQKQRLIERVKGIQFAGFNCMGEGDIDSEENPEVLMLDEENWKVPEQKLKSLVTSNAYYYADTNTISYCLGSLNATTSEFMPIWTLAHEMAHSFDSCAFFNHMDFPQFRMSNMNHLKLEEELLAYHPYGKVIGCLRKSTGARRASTGDEFMAAEENSTSHHSALHLCQDTDQMGEAFSDWFAADILVSYFEQMDPQNPLSQLGWVDGVSNIWRSELRMAETKHQSAADSSHPALDVRLDKILMMNPRLRQKMGCPPLPSREQVTPDTDAFYCAL